VSRRARIAVKTAVWILCLLPLVMLGYRAVNGDLTANPISFITNWLGQWTFRLLLASLALTPLRVLFGMSWPVSLRRLVGLFAFFYASLHFLVWILVDHFFNWGQMLADLLKRRYITVGMLALTLLLPLALTSTSRMVKRLGGANWRRLHRLVYAVGVLAALHFLWLAKKGRTDQYYYAAVLAVLLGVRVWDAIRRAARRRREARAARAPVLVPGGGMS
jgi:sulfoxide reductase heme-binding subunit YedZ